MEIKELPEEFGRMIVALFGEAEGQALLAALSGGASPVSIRVNPMKPAGTPLYDGMKRVPWNDNGCYLPERPQFTLNPLLHAGAFYVQEAASMIHAWIVSGLGLNAGSKAVDLCAAPGGKTGAVIEALPEDSLMVANEFVGQRANILRENMAKLGYPRVIVTNSAVEAIGRLGSTFDLMVADVPCSGEGMMRKEDVARSQWSPKLIRECRDLQRSILNNALPALRPGGYLIYSTCTFNKQEDEENVRWLMDEHGLENIPLDPPAEWNVAPSVDPAVSAMRFLPHKTAGEGLFVALLRKPEGAEEALPSLRPAKEAAGKDFRKKGKNTREPERKGAMVKDVREGVKWLSDSRLKLSVDEKGNVSAMDTETADMGACLRRAGARVLSAGVEVATVKGRDLVPSAPLALSTALARDAFPSAELGLDDALDYLRHEAVRMPDDTPRGFVIITFGGVPLGFVKNIGNRANNLYPAEWRIRKL